MGVVLETGESSKPLALSWSLPGKGKGLKGCLLVEWVVARLQLCVCQQQAAGAHPDASQV